MKWIEIKETARNLRKNQTIEEAKMWQLLRNRKFENLKFLRQHPIVYESVKNEHFFFVADFFCSEHNLVIELDGGIHELQKDKDERRDLILREKGFKTLRIKNEEIEDLDTLKD